MKKEKVYCHYGSNEFEAIVHGLREGAIECSFCDIGITREAYYYEYRPEKGDIVCFVKDGLSYTMEFKGYEENGYLSYFRLVATNSYDENVVVSFNNRIEYNGVIGLAKPVDIRRFYKIFDRDYSFNDGDIISLNVDGYIYLARFNRYISQEGFVYHEMVSINTDTKSVCIFYDDETSKEGFILASIDEQRLFYGYLNDDEHKSKFKPFDKVLVRDHDAQTWSVTLFSHMYGDKYICMGIAWKQCIPFNEKTEKLVGTTDKYEEL